MSKATKAIGAFFYKNGSKILITSSIITSGSAIVMAVRSTPKYQLLMEERKEELEVEDLKPTQKVKPIIKAYWPSIILLVLSGACTIGSHLIDKKHQAVLATALTASNAALSEFQTKAMEKIGEKKVTEIKDAIAKDKIEKNKVDPQKVIITPSKGKVLMFDAFSGRYFMSDVETVRRAVNKVNRQIPEEQYVSVNELYSELGMPEIDMGDQLGWHNDGCDGFEEVLSAQITDEGEPCIVISYEPKPDPIAWFHD